jgi:hypothetical protein
MGFMFFTLIDMALHCPSCNKLIFPLFASFGGKSKCPRCTTILTCKKLSSGHVIACLTGLALGNTIERFLRHWLSEGVAFVLVCGILVVLGVIISKLQAANSLSPGDRENSTLGA